MTKIAQDAAQLMDMLPEDEKAFAYEFIKKLVLAWDPDFTKVTEAEAEKIANAEKSGFVDDGDIDWDNLSSIVQ